MILSDAAIKNRTTVFVLVVFIVIVGGYSYFGRGEMTLAREAFPDVEFPLILVTTTNEGVSPQDMETQVTNEIETELTGLEDLDEVISTSSEGMSLIQVKFEPEVDVGDALQRVRDKVDLAKGELDDAGADEPIIQEISSEQFPVMIVNLSGDISIVRLKAMADDLEDAIEELGGVLNVDVLGAPEREIRLEIDQDRLAAYNLTMGEIADLIPSENVNVSAGGLETTPVKFNVRVPAEFEDPKEAQDLPLTVRNGKMIYLTDVAEVRDTFKDRSSFARLDGKKSITLSIQKRTGANIIKLVETIKHILKQAEKRAPRGVKIDVVMDMSQDIRRMVKDLENNVMTGFVLVLAVLMLFLGLRTSLIVAAAIPLSMLISMGILNILGYTLNMIVLFSLILALGMLVDNAIVIVENTHRHMEEGLDGIHAAMTGAGEVAWPVITSTATTLAAFFPLLYWPGIVGEFMKYLPVTLIVTLSSSLFVALVINPTIASVFARADRSKSPRKQGRFTGAYRRLLAAALNHRIATLATVVLVLVGLVITYRKMALGMEFFPDLDPKRGIINIRCPQGTNIEHTDKLARLVESRVKKYEKRLEHLVTNVGSAGGKGTLFGATGGAHMTNLTLVFHDYEDRRRPSAEVVADIRHDLEDIPGAEIKVEKEEAGPPTGEPITVRIIGENLDDLEKLNAKAEKLMRDVPGLVNLRSDLEAKRPELKFRPDRDKAAKLRINTRLVGQFLKMAIFGRAVSTFRQFNDEYDITVRLPEDQRTSTDDLFRLRVPNNTGQVVPLSSLGDFEYAPGLGNIHRVDRDRVVTLTASAEGRLDADVLADVQETLEENLDPPDGYQIKYAGQKQEQQEASDFLKVAFVAALLLIIFILIMQFNLLRVPVVIMTTVVLSFIGVLMGLLVFNQPFGVIMTGIGVISLAGVVVNNAIVLLAYTRQLQSKGMELVEAAVQAGVIRLRPVLLTAVTTILGLMPMATGVGFDFHTFEWFTRSESSEWWRPMAIAVIFGLAFATILTLVVVPTLYVILHRPLSRVQAEKYAEPFENSRR